MPSMAEISRSTRPGHALKGVVAAAVDVDMAAAVVEAAVEVVVVDTGAAAVDAAVVVEAAAAVVVAGIEIAVTAINPSPFPIPFRVSNSA